MVVLLIIGFLIVISLQAFGFLKKKQYKEFFVYLVIMVFAMIYAISGLTDWDFPEPSDLAEIIFEPLSNFVFQAHLRK